MPTMRQYSWDAVEETGWDGPEHSSWRCESFGTTPKLFEHPHIVMHEWEFELPHLVERWSISVKTIWTEMSRIELLSKEVLLLKSELARLENDRMVVVPIACLAPDPYELKAPISAVVRRMQDGYSATFFDANIGASGETEFEAVDNLKGMIVSAFEILREHSPDRLARSAARQKSVLDEYIVPRD